MNKNLIIGIVCSVAAIGGAAAGTAFGVKANSDKKIEAALASQSSAFDAVMISPSELQQQKYDELSKSVEMTASPQQAQRPPSLPKIKIRHLIMRWST